MPNAKIEVYPVPIHMLAEIWPHVAPHIMRGLSAATDVTLQQLVDDLLAGTDRLWVVSGGGQINGTFISAVFQDEDEPPYLGIYALSASDLKDCAKAIDEAMEKEARHQGCGGVRFCGRKGWSRVLPNYQARGTRDGHAIYERAVS